jgi:mannose-6-phosphate isomerase-like protein (cupin superfamily)
MSAHEKNFVSQPDHLRKATLAQAASLLPAPDAAPRSATVFRHGTLLVKLFAPRGKDSQGPHAQDELYIVAKGSGWFINGGERIRFSRNDVLFVPAGVTHRFEDFSDDLMLWVVFYGPEGGER